MSNQPRYTPLHPDFPVRQYGTSTWIELAQNGGIITREPLMRSPYLSSDAAPMSFTSVKGLGDHYPSLSWGALRQIWDYELHEEPARNRCDVCRGNLLVYGFAAQMSRAMVARACLSCRVRYLEPVTRSELHDRVIEWGFKDFKMGLGAGEMHGKEAQGSGEPATVDEAQHQLLESMLPDGMKGGDLGSEN